MLRRIGYVFMILGERTATLPPSHRSTPQRSLWSERGTPRFRAHALSPDPCRTGGKNCPQVVPDQ